MESDLTMPILRSFLWLLNGTHSVPHPSSLPSLPADTPADRLRGTWFLPWFLPAVSSSPSLSTLSPLRYCSYKAFSHGFSRAQSFLAPKAPPHPPCVRFFNQMR